jgi:hypothetical protein
MRNTLSLAACLLWIAAAQAGAATIYAVNNNIFDDPSTASDHLIRFDSSAPASYVTIGALGVPGIGFGGLDFDRSGNLWGYASFYDDNGGASSGLYKINVNTGQATLQGTASLRTLDDLAFNPTDNQMYGIRTQGNVSSLYTVNLDTGVVTPVGTFSGLPATHNLNGFGIDSAGNYYVQEATTDGIYKSGPDRAMTRLYDIGQDTNYSQGLTIDWSRDDTGYHAATGQGVFPNYFTTLNTFYTDGSGYTIGSDFGPNIPVGQFNFPPVEAGDLAIMPAVPEPASLIVLAFVPFLRRRR